MHCSAKTKVPRADDGNLPRPPERAAENTVPALGIFAVGAMPCTELEPRSTILSAIFARTRQRMKITRIGVKVNEGRRQPNDLLLVTRYHCPDDRAEQLSPFAMHARTRGVNSKCGYGEVPVKVPISMPMAPVATLRTIFPTCRNEKFR